MPISTPSLVQAPAPSRLALGALLFTLISFSSGCFTTLGYVPDTIKPRQISGASGSLVAKTVSGTWTPSLKEVKAWAYDVADGYGSRASANRNALYVGYFIAAAAAGAISGLAAYDSTNSAITGIPIGTGFLGAVAAYYHNDLKAGIYDLGNARVRDFIILSDRSGDDPDMAVCLRLDVSAVMDKVSAHIRLLDPTQLNAALRAVNGTRKTDKQSGTTEAAETQSEAPPVTSENKETVLAANNGDLSDLQGPVRSTCDAQRDYLVIEQAITALEERQKKVETLTEGTTALRDAAVELKKTADHLKADADDLVIRAGRIGNFKLAHDAQSLADKIGAVQKRASQLSA